MDLHGSFISSSKFSVDGSRLENEPFSLHHNFYHLPSFSYCFPHYISRALVLGHGFANGIKETRDTHYHPKLRIIAVIELSQERSTLIEETQIGFLSLCGTNKIEIYGYPSSLKCTSGRTKFVLPGLRRLVLLATTRSFLNGSSMGRQRLSDSTSLIMSSNDQLEYEKLKKQMKPDFLDMVPWYLRTSIDLFKTVFDLMVSVTLFVGRFDMRMMQAAMNEVPDESKISDLLYDHLQNRDKLCTIYFYNM
ncbi:uncharacterized protein LOC109705999 isoform X2 [Ananas comosus]|nr:uncharacterized protein LOC109705999 isoform X2 [Ananas comosus]XP_020082402.1 uncharacterized protein LOC109705999 isoform X2 [Ananas comosus]